MSVIFGHEWVKKEKPPKAMKIPMEFSKKILLVTSVIAVFILAYAMCIQYLIIVRDYQGDTNIVITLLSVLGAEVATGTGFYYWKAKSENIEREKGRNASALYEEEEENYEQHD